MYSFLLALVFSAAAPVEQNTVRDDGVRYLNMAHIEVEDRERYVKMASFVLNSLSREKMITLPSYTDKRKDIVLFNLRDYGIDPKDYDRMSNPYGPDNKVMRIDHFIVTAMSIDNYYSLLRVDNLADYRKLVFAHPDPRTAESVAKAGLLVNSKVTINNRMFKREPTLVGAMWESHDVMRSMEDRDLLKYFLDDKYDQRSFIANLSNGLHAFYAEDRFGQKVKILAPELHVDNVLGGSYLVQVPASCVACHRNGIENFNDDVRFMLKHLQLLTKDDTIKRRIESLYSGKLNFEEDQQRYREALLKTNGLSPAENADLFVDIFKRYNQPLMMKDGIRELKISKEQLFRAIDKINDPYLLRWRVGAHTTVSRDYWERIYKNLEQLKD